MFTHLAQKHLSKQANRFNLWSNVLEKEIKEQTVKYIAELWSLGQLRGPSSVSEVLVEG